MSPRVVVRVARTAVLVTAAAAAAATAATATARSAGAQALAARVAAVANGVAQVGYATRPEACGDGRNVVALGEFLTASGSVELHGWTNADCRHGPARLVLTVRGGEVADVRVHVGGAARVAEGARDLGSVGAVEAADYALALAGRLEGRAAQRAVVAAAVADSADVWRRLLALARGGAKEERTQRAAMHWLGAVAPPEAVGPLTALVRDARERRAVREGAVAALAHAPGGAGVPALVRVAQGDGAADGWVREKAIFWLGQADDERARGTLRALAAGDTVAAGAREQAIFALGHSDEGEGNAAFLRALYPRLQGTRLRERAIQSIAHGDDEASLRWLLDLAADGGEPLETRKQALFWAGQQDDFPVADLVAVYPRLSGQELRKHFTFVLSQRDEDAAVDRLIDVARRDPDSAVRRQALFWLGQSRHPRARQYLVEVIER